MADDKTKRDFRDRNRVSADENYEVEYFALEMGITPDQVRDLIRTIGNNRAALTQAASALKAQK
ncbi:DUF3606 domain-containing protein [Mesorhizobium sp. M6A.T.Cr.TU.017.01.1.1]|uniref:DUF3606 domain-containing protein n=1 Tax=Mesorhizobium sp. M6A.T.Cr.TU.017.01.1.1 TaxID=2496774 RepID=UPI000FD21DFE|nr:DUF3606 domain-containing protein [Mesorhizobium sp. M6A.T.Cr.TU.017.01.1.1]RUU98595.1 DUF3606 domain-containing protein [Mesorhizobium sp. M6A.T.Cr.TU.017.01.1.1]